MTAKETIKILKECELSDLEKDLFDVNIKLIKSKVFSVQKHGVSGLKELLETHSMKIGIKKILTNKQ